MTCIKMGSDESHYNVSLIVRDKVTRPCPQPTTFLKSKESRSGIEPRSFRLPAYRLTAGPNRLSTVRSYRQTYIYYMETFDDADSTPPLELCEERLDGSPVVAACSVRTPVGALPLCNHSVLSLALLSTREKKDGSKRVNRTRNTVFRADLRFLSRRAAC